MEIGLVKRVDIDQEMQQSYLDYAMSVIVARALPDARDGLKPVQRRILYGMYELGLRAETAYKKSARIVGEVLGKYHPHGDQAVYDAMARLAQDFSMRYALVDGQGNFGSVDGDPPAAMRYTEARLAPAAIEILSQLDRNTVNFTRNFDDTLNEPEVLPAAIPNLLVNGASGIAVGMATSIPPHNLDEVIGALRYMLEKWEKLEDVSVSDLMKFIKGPDFPTGGIILQENQGEELLGAYATGRGKVTLRGKVHLEEMGRGKSRMIISELPYQTNKASLIERIAELARENALEGISDLRDESDRGGMRIVVEVNRVADVENVLRELYKRTPLQTTFRISLLALVNSEPHMLPLKQALRIYLEHRLTVVKRRSEFDLERAKQRAHILEGLRIALQNLDEVIKLIRAAQDVDEARAKLMKRFKLSEIQSNAILEMPLRRLAALERKKIELEYKDVVAQIKELEALLRSPKKMRQAVGDELLVIKEKYGDKRRTQIVSLREGKEKLELLTTADVTPEQTVWVGVTEDGVIGRTVEEKLSRVSGKLAPRWIIRTTTHHTLYLAATDGRCAAVAVQSLPIIENFEDGVGLHKVSPFEERQQVSQIFSLPPKSDIEGERYIVTISRKGLIKKTAITELPGPSTQLFVLAKVNQGDELGWVFETDGKTDIVLVTRNGMAIRFSEDDVRPMGLIAAGVNGIKLIGEDELRGAVSFQAKAEMLLVCPNGKGWRIPGSELPRQGRYGQGIIACRPEKFGGITGFLYGKASATGLMHLAQSTSKNVRIDQISAGKRQSAAKDVITVRQGDHVTGITYLDVSEGTDSKKGAEPKTRVRAQVELPEESSEVSSPTLPGVFEEPPAAGRKSRKIDAGIKPAPRKEKSSRKTSGKMAISKGGAEAKKTRSKKVAAEVKPTTRARKSAAKLETAVERQSRTKTTRSARTISQPELTQPLPKPRKASTAVKTKAQPPAKKPTTSKAAPAGKKNVQVKSTMAVEKATGTRNTSVKSTAAKSTSAKRTPAKSTPAKRKPTKSTPAKSKPARGTAKPKTASRSKPAGTKSDRSVKKPAGEGK